MHSLKTGALFDAAILVPADLAGIASESREMQALTRFSRAFGLAFQTADDLQDAEQERDPSSGRYPETSVLHYLPAEAARSEAVRELDEAMAEIRGLWPASHAALIGVAQQLRSGLGTGG